MTEELCSDKDFLVHWRDTLAEEMADAVLYNDEWKEEAKQGISHEYSSAHLNMLSARERRDVLRRAACLLLTTDQYEGLIRAAADKSDEIIRREREVHTQ